MSKVLIPNPTTQQHLLRALTAWPADALRPTCQLRDTLLRRSGLAPSTPSPSSTSNKTPPKTASSTPPPAVNPNTLYSLLNNRYSKQYPIRNNLLSPPGNPTYYTDLVKELEQAPQRSFWDRTKASWKGFLRFK